MCIHLSISINTIAHHTKEWVITHSQKKKERARSLNAHNWQTDTRGYYLLMGISSRRYQKRKMINARPSRGTTVVRTFSVSCCCCWQLCDDNSSQLFGTRFSFIFLYWRRRKGRRRSTSEMSTSLVPPVVHFFVFPCWPFASEFTRKGAVKWVNRENFYASSLCFAIANLASTPRCSAIHYMIILLLHILLIHSA